MDNLNHLLENAIEAALLGGKEILRIYNTEKTDISFKDDDSPLTQADLASNQAIISILENTGIMILSEEGKQALYKDRKTEEQLWIIDPLDGTKEFIKRNGDFTVNIALISGQKVILGVVYTPVSGELFFASESIGSFKFQVQQESPSITQILETSVRLPMTKTDVYTVVASASHLSTETEVYITNLRKKYPDLTISSRGSSLKLCMVAEGSADCYPRFAPTMEWDIAAGHAICKFADKQVIDQKTGMEMLYNRENLLNNWFIAQ